MVVSGIIARKGDDVFTSRPDAIIKDLTTGLQERRIGFSVTDYRKDGRIRPWKEQ